MAIIGIYFMSKKRGYQDLYEDTGCSGYILLSADTAVSGIICVYLSHISDRTADNILYGNV
jgi:hypothetical protein